MANQEHLERLKEGTDAWNTWRQQLPDIEPDLSQANLNGANLRGANLRKANLRKANLSHANLSHANFFEADLSHANFFKANLQKAIINRVILIRANLRKADLSDAQLCEADLSGANLQEAELFGVLLILSDLRRANLSYAALCGANLSKADLSGANLEGANLRDATLVETDFTDAILNNCRVYGTSVWNIKLRDTKQENLIITPYWEPEITVDNLEVAQFIYLLLNNSKIREFIDTITSKVVLILGRFTQERKQVLDALREELRKQNYLPVLFDFEKPANRDITETISTLAHIARFVIADITEPKSIPQELSHIIPFLPSVPIVPLMQVSEREYGMYEHFISYPWVQPIYHYRNLDELLHFMQEHIIESAEKKVRELAIEKAKRLESP